MQYDKETTPHYTLWHNPPEVYVLFGDPLFSTTTAPSNATALDQACHAILASALFKLGFEDFTTLASTYAQSFRRWAFPTFSAKTRFKASIPASLVHNWLRRAFEKEGLDVPAAIVPPPPPLPAIPEVKLPPLEQEDYDNYMKSGSSKYKNPDYHPKKKGKHHARRTYEG